MGNELSFMFTFPVGITCWRLGEHESLIIALILNCVSRRNWRGPWTIKGSDWEYVTTRTVELECNKEWEQPGFIQMEGKLSQVSE